MNRLLLPVSLLLIVSGVAWSGPLIVENPQHPRDGACEIVLKEIWRHGGEDSELFFGNVLQVIPAGQGGAYVLDSQLLKVFHLDAQGQLIGTLGGQGEGPGEITNVNSIMNLPDGNLGMGQVLPGVVACLQPDGTPAGKIHIHDREDAGSTFVLFMDGWAQGENLLAIAMRWRMPGASTMVQDMYLRSYDLQGQPLVDFLHKKTEFNLADFVLTEKGYDFVWTRCGVLPGGQAVFVPERDVYAIHVARPDGQLERIIKKEEEPWCRDAHQKEEARLSHAAVASHYGREVRGVVAEKTDPAVTALTVLEDGRLWVRSSQGDRAREPGLLTTLDEFDPEGLFIRNLKLRGPGDPAQDAIHILSGSRLVLVTGAAQAYRREQNTERADSQDDEKPVEVTCYQLVAR
jgi:hypothetical protein